MPDLQVLIGLADFYDVDIHEIIDGEKKSDNPDYRNGVKHKKVTKFVW